MKQYVLNLIILMAVLIPAQVQAADTLTNGLVGHWKFDEIAGGVIKDFSPAGNNSGLLVAGSTARLDAAGKYGKALAFDNAVAGVVTKQYVTTSNTFSSNQWSLSLWFNPAIPIPTTSPYGSMLTLFSVDSGGAYGLQSLAIQRKGIYNYNTLLMEYNFEANPGWHHIVFTYDGQYLKIVIDNSFTASFPYKNLMAGVLKRYIGVMSPFNTVHFFKGLIDEVRLYSRPLTKLEITLLYDPDLKIPTTPPVITKTWPMAKLPSWTRYTHIAIHADRPVFCRASKISGQAFKDMTLVFNTYPVRKAYLNIFEPKPGQNLKYYVRCEDNFGIGVANEMMVDISISEDTVPPPIIELSASAVRDTTAEIVWSTKERANGYVEYWEQGKTEITKFSNPAFSYPHAQLLKGLKPNTTYFYKVSSTDESGNKSTSAQQSFKTTGTSAGLVYYVDIKNGNDNNAGTEGQPFATIQKARDTIRPLIKNMPVGGVVVYIRGGIYPQTTPFILTAQDSGTKDSPIVYKAYGNEKVIISGSREISGFVPVPTNLDIYKNKLSKEVVALPNGQTTVARDNILQIDLRSKGITDFGTLKNSGAYLKTLESALNLYFQDKPMTLARWPNENPNDLYSSFTKVKSIPTGTTSTIVSHDSRPSRWTYPTSSDKYDGNDIFVHGAWFFDYRYSHLRIKGMTPEATGGYRLHVPGDFTNKFEQGRPFYYENVLEELDSPGEWYLDRGTGILYFWPPAPLSTSKAYVSMTTATISPIPSVLNFSSLLVFKDKATYIKFSGITFEHARGTAIVMGRDTSFNMIENSVIRNAAVAMYIAGKHNGVWGSDIYQLEDNGIVLYGGEDKTLEGGYNFVVNNKIHDYAMRNHGYRAAVNMTAMDTYTLTAGPSRGVSNRVRYNQIYNGPHYGVVISGNNYLVDYNEIYNVATMVLDAGAIYFVGGWTARGSLIQYNYIHDMKGFDFTASNPRISVAAIYPDNDMDGVDIYGNVINRISGLQNKNPVTNIGYLLNGGRDHTFKNNIIVNTDEPFHIGAPGMTFTAKFYRIPIVDVSNTTPINIKTIRPHENYMAHESGASSTVIVSDVLAPQAANGTWEFSLIDQDVIGLKGSTAAGAYTEGGYLIQSTAAYDTLKKYLNPLATALYPQSPDEYPASVWKDFYPTLTRRLFEVDDAEPKGNSITHNVLYKNTYTDKIYATSIAEKYVVPVDTFKNDPLFVDLANDNLQLQDNSPVYAMGFTKIPFDEIGLIKDSTSPPVGPQDEIMYGDVSGNKRISLYDAVMILRYLRNPALFNDSQEGLADVNHKEGINNDDADLVAQYVLGLITSFNVIK